MIRAVALMCGIVIAALTTAGCGRGAPAGSQASLSEEAGTIIATESLTTIDSSLRSATALAERITYTSRSGVTDALTRVTGSVFVPRGKAPDNGWQIVVLGHPTTGTRPGCAPSLSPTLLGTSAIVRALVEAGYLVSMPDYQGLGNVGDKDQEYDSTYYPYLDSTTAGYNMIHSVRAVRKLVPEASNNWAALGISEGGQAAWAANELMDNHGWELNLVGSASLSPMADINGLADAAESGHLTKGQQLVLQAFLEALKSEYRNEFNLDDYRHAVVSAGDDLSTCHGPAPEQGAKAAGQLTSDDLRPATSKAAAALRGYLKKTSLPQGPTQAPMLVIYGGQDSLVPPAWTDNALYSACKMGDVIQIQMQPDKGHKDIDPSTAIGWIGERFKSAPAANDCGSFTATYESARQRNGSR